MTPAEMVEFVAASRAGYIADGVEAGQDPGEPTKVADEQTTAMFPYGVPAPGHHLFRVEDAGQTVRSFWLGHEFAKFPWLVLSRYIALAARPPLEPRRPAATSCGAW